MEQINAVTPDLSENVKALFVLYFKDACNWGGEPLVGGNVELLGAKQDRGLLTQLKVAGLVRTTQSDGWSFVSFTDAGVAYAKTLGLEAWWA